MNKVAGKSPRYRKDRGLLLSHAEVSLFTPKIRRTSAGRGMSRAIATRLHSHYIVIPDKAGATPPRAALAEPKGICSSILYNRSFGGRFSMTMTETRVGSKTTTAVPWIFFTLLCLATVALFMVPAYIIQPFKFQSPRALAIAIALRHASPWLTLITAALALTAAILLWHRISHWKKTFLFLGMSLAIAASVMARIDYFEWMFHPNALPGFTFAKQIDLNDSEMVMAVRFEGNSRAYPIREMAYHHIVNDVVGSVPIAVTY